MRKFCCVIGIPMLTTFPAIFAFVKNIPESNLYVVIAKRETAFEDFTLRTFGKAVWRLLRLRDYSVFITKSFA